MPDEESYSSILPFGWTPAEASNPVVQAHCRKMNLQPTNIPSDSPIMHTVPVKQRVRLAQILRSVPTPRRANSREKIGSLEETFLVSVEEQRPNKNGRSCALFPVEITPITGQDSKRRRRDPKSSCGAVHEPTDCRQTHTQQCLTHSFANLLM